MTPDLAAAVARLDFQAGHSPAGCLLTLSKSDWGLIRAALATLNDAETESAYPPEPCATPPPSPSS